MDETVDGEDNAAAMSAGTFLNENSVIFSAIQSPCKIVSEDTDLRGGVMSWIIFYSFYLHQFPFIPFTPYMYSLCN